MIPAPGQSRTAAPRGPHRQPADLLCDRGQERSYELQSGSSPYPSSSSPKRSPATRQRRAESDRAARSCVALAATCDQTVLDAAFDAVLLDFKAAYAGEVDCLVIGVATPAERIEVLGASPPLEDIDPCGVHRIGRDREVETTRCSAGEAHSANTCHDMGVSVRWIEDEVTGDDEHPPIVPTGRYHQRRKRPRRSARPRGLCLRGRSALALSPRKRRRYVPDPTGASHPPDWHVPQELALEVVADALVGGEPAESRMHLSG